MNATDSFFEEFKDNKEAVALWAVILVVLFLIIAGIYSNFRGDTDIVFACTIYLFMIVMAFVVFMIDNNLEHNKIASCVLSGDHPMMGVAFLGAGALFGALLVSQHQSIGVTLLQLTGTQKFLFTVGVAAVVEEMFFRWTMFPTIRQLLMGKVPYASVVALFVVNISFGLFHFYVYNASLAGVWLACILGIIYTIGNYACKSGNFSLGAHAMNNFLMMSVSI